MRWLWVTTKMPWPPHDGGRLLVEQTATALAAGGDAVTVVAARGRDDDPRPSVEAAERAGCVLVAVASPARGWLAGGVAGLVARRSITFTRHAHPELGAVIAAEIERVRTDVVVVEQPQLVATARAAARGRVPVVLRAQNVESELWSGLASTARVPLAPWLALEARRVRADERRAVAAADVTVALSARDRDALVALAGRGARVEWSGAPFAAELPAGERRLSGAPPLTLLGVDGWLPNRDGARWFLERIWPEVERRHATVELHVFGGAGAFGRVDEGRIHFHPSPRESREAFAVGGVLLVPLRVASGVRMKILEAWARGTPVIASRAAAAGLACRSGDDLLVADDAAEMLAALEALADPARRARLVAGGRQVLRSHHDPAGIADEWRRLGAGLSAPPSPT